MPSLFNSAAARKLHGLLPVYKPKNFSSHQLVLAARRQLKEKKIGHSGTLDPFAEGLLLLTIGEATKLQNYFMQLPKTYLATFYFGYETDTLDPTGKITHQATRKNSFTKAEVEQCLHSHFLGEIQQRPPKFSAVKIKGQRAYALSRAGREFSLTTKRVVVESWRILHFSNSEMQCEISCSAGTYVRSLARDVARKLNTYGHLRALMRSQIGPFSLSQAERLSPTEVAPEVKPPAVLSVADYLPGTSYSLSTREVAQLNYGRLMGVEKEVLRAKQQTLLLFFKGELVMVLKKEKEKIKIVYNRIKEFFNSSFGIKI